MDFKKKKVTNQKLLFSMELLWHILIILLTFFLFQNRERFNDYVDMICPFVWMSEISNNSAPDHTQILEPARVRAHFKEENI